MHWTSTKLSPFIWLVKYLKSQIALGLGTSRAILVCVYNVKSILCWGRLFWQNKTQPNIQIREDKSALYEREGRGVSLWLVSSGVTVTLWHWCVEMVGRGSRCERDEAFLQRMYSYINLHIVWDNNHHPKEHSTHTSPHTNHLFVSYCIMKWVEFYSTKWLTSYILWYRIINWRCETCSCLIF